MSQQYDFPDDPEVFARVLEHFRTKNAAYWDARLDRYAREAQTASSASTGVPAASVVSRTQKSKTIASNPTPTKPVSGASRK